TRTAPRDEAGAQLGRPRPPLPVSMPGSALGNRRKSPIYRASSRRGSVSPFDPPREPGTDRNWPSKGKHKKRHARAQPAGGKPRAAIIVDGRLTAAHFVLESSRAESTSASKTADEPKKPGQTRGSVRFHAGGVQPAAGGFARECA